MNTIVAAECTSSPVGASINNTFSQLLPVLDAFFLTQGFETMAPVLANCDCDTVVFTSDYDDVTADGLG
jgi:hypothetical protein